MWDLGAAGTPPFYVQRAVHRIFAVQALFFLVVGCGVETSPRPSAEVRDSAGVTIVENRGSVVPGGGEWDLSTEPSLVIGSFEGPEEAQLYRVRGGLRLPDGRFVVANEGTWELRIFGSDGSHLGSMGGEGEGPGEFNSVRLLGLLGDSLLVLDRRLRRVSLIHPDEGFVRSFPLAEGVAAYPMDGWLFNTGSILIQDLPLSESGAHEEGFNRTPVPYKSSDLSGALLTDFGKLPGAEMVNVTRQTEHGLATLLSSVPFGKAPEVAVAGDRLFFASHDGYEVKVLGSDGSLQRIVRLDHVPIPVTEEDLAAFVEEEIAWCVPLR
ncbi:hypothetical protein ACFL3S_05750, partial [Gemmatimonadota bacterium]